MNNKNKNIEKQGSLAKRNTIDRIITIKRVTQSINGSLVSDDTVGAVQQVLMCKVAWCKMTKEYTDAHTGEKISNAE